MKHSRSRVSVVATGCLFLFLVGCREKVETIPTSAVSGRVTLDGKPLESGAILFYPDVDDQKKPLRGKMAQTQISQGNYRVPQSPGVVIGRNRVVITATRVVGKEKLDGQEVDKVDQYLPAKYNSETTLFLDVKPGEQTHDFELSSK